MRDGRRIKMQKVMILRMSQEFLLFLLEWTKVGFAASGKVTTGLGSRWWKSKGLG